MTKEDVESERSAHSLAQICKALGNPVRISILRYVLDHPNCIGNEILLHLPDDGPHAQSTLSQHLRQLRESGLLDAFSDGAAVCYRVNSKRIGWLCDELDGLRERAITTTPPAPGPVPGLRR